MMEPALEALLMAYAKGEVNGGSISWEDLGYAFELAREALPGRYMEMVRELGGDQE